MVRSRRARTGTVTPCGHKRGTVCGKPADIRLLIVGGANSGTWAFCVRCREVLQRYWPRRPVLNMATLEDRCECCLDD